MGISIQFYIWIFCEFLDIYNLYKVTVNDERVMLYLKSPFFHNYFNNYCCWSKKKEIILNSFACNFLSAFSL